jgi:hypothetical protein
MDPVSAAPSTEVVRDTAHHRLLWAQDGSEAELVYRRRGNRLFLIHTGVPEALGGKGIAGKLVQSAVDWAERDHLTLVPICAYARKWLSEHPDAVTNVEIHWRKPASAPDQTPAEEGHEPH